MRNKPKFSKILSSQPHLLPWLNFPHNFLYFLFPSNAEEQGMGLWSDTLSLLFLPPLLHGSLPQEAVLQELLQSASFSSGAAVLHELLQLGSLPVWCSRSGTDCSSMDPPQGHKSCQQTLYSSSLHRATGPARSLLQHRLPDFLRHPSALGWDPPQAVGGDLLHHIALLGHPTSPWSGPRAATESWLPCLKHHFPLLLQCPCLQRCFYHIFSLLSSQIAVAVAQVFFPFLKRHYPRGTTTVTDGLGLSLSQ